MFENIHLITKKNNKAEEPNTDWTIKSRIFCICDLSLGLGDKISWTSGNAIPLTDLIDFYNKACYDRDNNEYSFRHNDSELIFSWTMSETAMRTTVRRKYYNTNRIVLEKENWGASTIYESRLSFFMKVMNILTENTTVEVCMHIGGLFFQESQHTYEFRIGERVKTILGKNVKTERTGFIINRFYHDKEKTNMYQLLIDGKRLDKRYYPDDLEKF